MNTRPANTGFIPEIQGMRTVALLLVATFHIWFGRVSGGVDIFLLISAYLMTRSLTNRFEAGRSFNPGSFLLKKFARLMPAAVAVIILTTIAAVTILPIATGQTTITNAVASLFYIENINLQQQATNYFNANQSLASPFQHFWSLSIQGQVFVLWAFIHALAALFARRVDRSIRPILLVIFGLIAMGSFGYSLWLTAVNQPHAYFDTGARLWEFAAGSLLAVVQPWIRLNALVRTVASWLGLVAMISCGFVLPVSSSFPGLAALWPVTSAALIILASGAPTKFGADRLLASSILKTVGGYTYALYLTHWPVLIFYRALTHTNELDAFQGILVMAAAAVLAVAIVHLVERPVARFASPTVAAPAPDSVEAATDESATDVASEAKEPTESTSTGRRKSPRAVARQSITIVLCLVLGAGGVIGGSLYQKYRTASAYSNLQAIDPSIIGANAIGAPDIPLQLDWGIVETDWSKPGFECDADDRHRTDLCYETRIATDTEPAHRVLAIGSSHMTQFTAVLKETVGRHDDIMLRTQVAPGCYFQYQDDLGGACKELWTTTTKYITDEQPDLVVVYITQGSSGEQPDAISPELVQWIKEVRKKSPTTQVIALRDNARMEVNPVECAQEFGPDAEQCLSKTDLHADPAYIAEVEAAGAIWVDLRQWQCPDGICRPVIGGVPVYFDDHHITATYSRTMAQHFADQIAPQVSWWPKNAYEGEYVEKAAVDSDTSQDLNNAG